MKNKTFKQIKRNGLTFNFLALDSDYFKIEIINKMGSHIERMYEEQFNKSVYGISHFIEHLAFKSPKDYSTKELNDALKAEGTYNASTDFERINYWFKTTPDRMDKAINLVTNIAYNTLENVNAEEFLTERNVVKNEVKRYQDDDQQMFWIGSTTKFCGNKIEDNVLGTPEIVDTFELEDCIKIKNFFLNYGETVINITFNPGVVSETEIMDKVQKKIDRHHIKPSNIKNEYFECINDASNINSDGYLKNPSEQVITVLNIDCIQDRLIANTANNFISSFSKNSLNELIRKQNGLTYGVYFGTHMLGYKNYTFFGCDVTGGTEDKLMELFRESISKTSGFSEEEYNEYQVSSKLKRTMGLINLENNGTWFYTATWEPEEFEIFRNTLENSIDDANLELDSYCSYNKIKDYILNLNNMVQSDNFSKITNKEIK